MAPWVAKKYPIAAGGRLCASLERTGEVVETCRHRIGVAFQDRPRQLNHRLKLSVDRLEDVRPGRERQYLRPFT